MKVRYELSGMNPPSGAYDSLECLTESTSTSTATSTSTDDSQLENNDNSESTNLSTKSPQTADLLSHNNNDSSQSNVTKNRKRSNHKKQRGRGRSSHSNSTNVTDRSSWQQSGYKQQLSSRDQEFLSMNNYRTSHHDPHTGKEITTSTPKDANSTNTKQLSDSELLAMGIDPSSEYAGDVRRKYSMT